MTVAGKQLATSLHSTITALLNFDTAKDGTYRVKVHYKNFELEQTIDGFNKSIKQSLSDNNGDTALQKMMENVRQIQFELGMNKQGKVVNHVNNDSLFSMFSNTIGIGKDSMAVRFFEGMRPFFNNEMVKGLLEQALFVFPDKTVNVGDTWTNKLTIQSFFSMKMTTDFELISLSDSVAELALKSRVSPGNSEVVLTGLAMAASPITSPKITDKSKGVDIGGMKMKAEFTGTQTGKVFIDLRNKTVKSTTVRQILTGDLIVGIFMLPMEMDMVSVYNLSGGKQQ